METNLVLCKDAVTLYLAWSKLLDTHAERALVTAAKRAYVQHRQTCQECSVYLNKLKIDENCDNAS